MKTYLVCLMMSLAVMSASARDVSADVADGAVVVPAVTAGDPADAKQLPADVVTEQNPLKTGFMAKATAAPALFRPNPSMPEVVNEDLLRGMVDTGKVPSAAPRKASTIIGYIPKLKVLPCAKGCSGSDYDRAVKEFVTAFRGDSKLYAERGEMIVQVRWFNVRPFLMRQMPYSSDLFGISFVLEGKLVSLGMKSGAGISVSAHELASDMGARLAMELEFSLGMGVKPTFLTATNDAGVGVTGAVMSTGAAINGLMGIEDVRSRIEPVTMDQARALLPAIDGINPGEVAQIDKMRYLNTLMF